MKTVKQRLNLFKLSLNVLSHKEALGVGLHNRCFVGVAIQEANKKKVSASEFYGVRLRELINAVKINNKTMASRRNVRMYFHATKLMLS